MGCALGTRVSRGRCASVGSAHGLAVCACVCSVVLQLLVCQLSCCLVVRGAGGVARECEMCPAVNRACWHGWVNALSTQTDSHVCWPRRAACRPAGATARLQWGTSAAAHQWPRLVAARSAGALVLLPQRSPMQVRCMHMQPGAVLLRFQRDAQQCVDICAGFSQHGRVCRWGWGPRGAFCLCA